jgi:hypothetical protein
MLRRPSFLLVVLSVTAALVVSAACSPGGLEDGSGSGGSPSGGNEGGGATGAEGSGASGAQGGGPGNGGSGGELVCDPGTTDCNMSEADGCEATLDSNVANCGACGEVCPVPSNSTATCVAGQCGFECSGTYLDCNGNAADGCEALLTNDIANCGACGTICPPGTTEAPLCVFGECTLDCAAGTASCDAVAANGCETNAHTSQLHCGGCGIDCGSSPCISGACACASETQQAQTAPLDLFIMLDQSGSMLELVQGGDTRWEAVTTALNGYFAAPANAGVGVGLQYFPLLPNLPPPVFCATDADCGLSDPCLFGLCLGGGGSNGTDSCNPADYAVPEVGIAPLSPAHANSLSASIAAHAPTLDTPTGAALKGALSYAKSWGQAHPSHVVAVVLATDGEPTECTPQDIFSIAGIAQKGLNGNPSVKTFVIGVGSSLANLNAIAASGGSGSAFLVDTNQNVVQQLTAALAAIQQQALGCEYAIPQPQMGNLDFTKVNVQYTPGGGMPVLLGNVANAAACDPQSGGWYYDNPANPTKIMLCPATCSTVQVDPSGEIEILLGCDTIHE